jgi:hypothetical protein
MIDSAFRRAERADPAIVSLLAEDELGRIREDARSPLNACYVTAFQAIDAEPNQLLVVAADAEAIVGTLHLTFIPGLARYKLTL